MEIKSHIFFSLINWDDLINKKITPPFNPNVVSICLWCKNSETQKVSFLSEFGETNSRYHLSIDPSSQGRIILRMFLSQVRSVNMNAFINVSGPSDIYL